MTTTKSAGTDALEQEIAALTAASADHEKRIAALEGGAVTQPPTQPPSGDFVWNGIDTKWPDASTTGPRVALTDWTGSTRFTEKQTIKGKRFRETVYATVDGLEFEDCEFLGFVGWGIDADSKRLVARHCRFTGGGSATAQAGAAILAICTEIVACDISGCEDGIKAQEGPGVIRGNYLHDPAGQVGGHYDGIQISGTNNDMTIEQNYISWIDNACVFVKPDFGPVSNTIVRHNYLTGGGFAVYFDNQKHLGLTGSKLIENIIEKVGYDYVTITDCEVEQSGNLDPRGNPLPTF